MNHRLAEIETRNDLSLQGCLLVANPHWKDEQFSQSVMMVVHHSDGNAIGITLNKDFKQLPSEIWTQLLGAENGPTNPTPIRFGGPQSGPVIALHDCEELAEFSTAEGVHFAAHVHHLQQLFRRDDASVRLIVGQSEWKNGELENQLESGLWLPIPPSRDIVFEDGTAMWVSGLRAAGNAIVCGLTGVPQPKDLRAN